MDSFIYDRRDLVDKKGMLALSIRQPYAELILRGIKTVELRTRTTRIIGERFYLYAPKAKAKRLIWSDDLRVGNPAAWMIELAKQVRLLPPDADWPTGVIVGSAVIEKLTKIAGPHPNPSDSPAGRVPARGEGDLWQWHLADVERAKTLRKPRRHPQPVWWRPF